MHGKPLVSSPCRTPLIWIYYNIYIYNIYYNILSVAFVPPAARSTPFMGYRGKLAIPRRGRIPHGWCWFPYVIITEYSPCMYLHNIYIYMRESWSWQARFALAIVNLAYRDILWTQLLGPFIHSFIHSFIETKWSLLAFWSSSICGYMHTYHCIVWPLCSPCVLGMCTACAIRKRPGGADLAGHVLITAR